MMSNLNKAPIWVEERLEELLSQIQETISLNQRPPDQVILVDAEVIRILKISKRTLASLREKGTLSFSKLGGKIFYTLADVLAMVESHKVQPPITNLRIGRK